MKAVVVKDIASLYVKPTTETELADEALFGMELELFEQPHPGWFRARTHYRYEGFVQAKDLLLEEESVRAWADLPKQVALAPYLDVMKQPAVQAARLCSLPRGGLLRFVEDAEGGWALVEIPGGIRGYARKSHLGPHIPEGSPLEESRLREKLVETAKSYMGSQYRWGGKTPLGIDCSGLTAISYLLHGIVIYRDASIREGYAMREIPQEQMKQGDLLFFKGHVAMYIGDRQYIHSTGRAGSDGVVINSLDPLSPLYREDLAKGILQVGSVFF